MELMRLREKDSWNPDQHAYSDIVTVLLSSNEILTEKEQSNTALF